jgi:predicted nucleic acid-binding Zn finger protein
MCQRNYESTTDKALRLSENHRVILTGFVMALVIGDNDTYQVEKNGLQWSCDCKWAKFRGAWKDCSHIIAVKRARKEPQSQVAVARLADLLMEAKVG